jgi:hypothetical protein
LLGGNYAVAVVDPRRGTERVVERRDVLRDFNELSSSEFPAVFPQGNGTTVLFKKIAKMSNTGHSDGRQKHTVN